jgi:hypothetical protein
VGSDDEVHTAVETFNSGPGDDAARARLAHWALEASADFAKRAVELQGMQAALTRLSDSAEIVALRRKVAKALADPGRGGGAALIAKRPRANFAALPARTSVMLAEAARAEIQAPLGPHRDLRARCAAVRCTE